MTDLEMQQQPDRYRYYITNDALLKGSFPYMGESDQVRESIKPLTFENGAVTAYGFVEYPAPLTPEQEKEYSLRPSSANANYLAAAEMSVEQNYNQIDGLVNNQEPPRVNQGYTIIDSEIVGHKEFVLAESPTAPQPYVTWARNIQNDEQMGGENFFWGHYFTDPDRAREDLHTRADEERESLKERRPSILSQLKSDAPQKDLPAAPQPGHKKDAPER